MDRYPITARSLEKFYYIKGDEFERAYKNHLSDYRQWKQLEHADQWLLFPENIGTYVSIDETSMSDGEVYTIISNKAAHGRKGSLIAIIKGTKAENAVKILKTIPWYQRSLVHDITMDFSDSMHAIATQSFPFITITIDRFHVMKEVLEPVQQLRLKHKREAQREEVEAREQHRYRNKRNAERRKEYAEQLKAEGKKKSNKGRKPNRINEQYTPERLSNGETKIELLTRSSYLLMKSPDKWTKSQSERAEILFGLYPDIQTAFGLAHGFRMIFSKKGATKESGKKSLGQWFNKVSEFDDKNFNTVSAVIYERQDEILNFFLTHQTNAAAESLNSRIKAFRAQLHGIVDIKFFLYRVSKIWA